MRTILPRGLWAWIPAAWAAAVLAGCAGPRAGAEPEPGPDAGPLAVTRGDFESRLLLTGELRAADAETLIAPNVRIWPLQVRWLAQDGEEVAAGDVVVEFDNSQLLSNLEELQVQALEAESRLEGEAARVAAEIAAAEFEVERQQAAVAKARIDAAVPAELLAEREHEKRQLETRRAELELEGARRKLRAAGEAGEADVELQRVALAKARSAVARAEAAIDKLTLRAPRGGILIVAEDRREGRPIRPGDSVFPGQEVARLPDLETLEVEARLFDVDDERVRPAQAVRARLDAFPATEHTGRVREVDDLAQQTGPYSLRRYFGVKVALDTVDVELMRPGMSVKLLIAEPPREDVLLVPRVALDWSAGEPRAALANGTLAPVELGPCNAFHCVVEAGLAEAAELRRVGGS